MEDPYKQSLFREYEFLFFLEKDSRYPKKFAEPTAQGVLDPPASPVFVYYSTIPRAHEGALGRSAAETA